MQAFLVLAHNSSWLLCKVYILSEAYMSHKVHFWLIWGQCNLYTWDGCQIQYFLHVWAPMAKPSQMPWGIGALAHNPLMQGLPAVISAFPLSFLNAVHSHCPMDTLKYWCQQQLSIWKPSWVHNGTGLKQGWLMSAQLPLWLRGQPQWRCFVLLSWK